MYLHPALTARHPHCQPLLARHLLTVKPLPTGQPVLTPTELLVHLHSVATAPTGPTVRQLIAAVDSCVADRATFGEDVLASALQQLLPR